MHFWYRYCCLIYLFSLCLCMGSTENFIYQYQNKGTISRMQAPGGESEISSTLIGEEHDKETARSPKKKRRKQKKNKSFNDKKSPTKPRPNYFLGIRIINPTILGRLNAVQCHITSCDERLTKAVVPTCTSHITLAVLHLKDANDIARAKDLLQDCHKEILVLINSDPLNISLKGIGDFRQQVVFAKIAAEPNLEKLVMIADYLGKQFAEFIDPDQKAFKPHVTLMKLSKMHNLRRLKLRNIHPNFYSKFSDISFGVDRANYLQLLSMLKRKASDGYYHSECEIDLISAKSFDPSNRLEWSLNNWAEQLSVSCITLAMYTNDEESNSRYSDNVVDNIMKNVWKDRQEPPYEKRGFKRGINKEFDKFKQVMKNDSAPKKVSQTLMEEGV